MSAKSPSPTVYTETEIRSLLPSGWGIVPGAAGRWDAGAGSWSIDLFDGADQVWKIEVDAADAGKAGRLEALDAVIRKLERKALGRKSVISG